MDIQEVKQERTKLETDIAELVNGFQQRTGLTVSEVRLKHLLTVASEIPVRTQVEARVGLP